MFAAGNPAINVLIGLLALIMSAIAIIGVITTYTGAGHGKVVTRSRIQLFGVFEIIAGLLRMFGDPITGIVLIVAGVFVFGQYTEVFPGEDIVPFDTAFLGNSGICGRVYNRTANCLLWTAVFRKMGVPTDIGDHFISA